jgi:hypothetical protein
MFDLSRVCFDELVSQFRGPREHDPMSAIHFDQFEFSETR